MFTPRVLRPLPVGPAEPALADLLQYPLCVVTDPTGCFLGERFAYAIESAGRWDLCAWLRDPPRRAEAAIVAMAETCAHRWTHGSTATQEGAASNPFATAAPGCVVVVEITGSYARRTADAVAAFGRAAENAGASIVVVVPKALRPLRRAAAHIVSASRLMPSGPAETPGLSDLALATIEHVAAGHGVMLCDIRPDGKVWLPERITDAVRGTRNANGLLDDVTASLLELCTTEQRKALEIVSRVGYWHPQFSAGSVGASSLRPWILPLEDDWGWLRPLWAKPLEKQIRAENRRRFSLGRPTPEDTHHVALSPDVEPANPVWLTQLDARLFGSFELRIDGRAIQGIEGTLGASVLRFLLARDSHACSRDQLLETFWPGADPTRSRNRLQVALSGTRRRLRDATELRIVEYHQGSYRIQPEVEVHTDVDRFERAVRAGQTADLAGDRVAALVGYNDAIQQYRGDFCADSPFEDWTTVPRESMRIRLIDVLDRTAELQEESGDLNECIASAQRMLEQDPCREDVHRLLMRCYSRQGRSYQVLRQFELCKRVLWAATATAPSPQTTATYLAMRDAEGS